MKTFMEDSLDLANCFDSCSSEVEVEGSCAVLTGDGRFLPFQSWEDAKYFYRERAGLLDEAIFSARFFLCGTGQWQEVAPPGFAN